MLTLVVGVGNPWRGDDAAGLVVADRVRAQARGVPVETLEGDVSALVHLWAGHDDVALVDAASSGAPPGTLHELRHDDGSLQAAALRSSTHAFGVADAVGLAAALGRLPARLEIYAIEGEDFSLGAPLSPAVARTVDALAERFAARSPDFPAGRRGVAPDVHLPGQD
jgi:hydrogenase maturation protease